MEPSSTEYRSRLNRLRTMGAEGRCIFGAIAASPVVQVVQVLARSGRDCILIDSEHGPIGPAEAHTMSAATTARCCCP